jgi:hypothetical protein
MDQKATRQQEEMQSMQIFIENCGKKFRPDLIVFPPQNDPCDITYKEVNYQITYGDQKLIGDIRKQTSKKKIYCGIRNESGNYMKYAKKFIYDALKKKLYQSSNNITLLIHCSFKGIYDPAKTERNKIFKDFIMENQDLIGAWQNIYIVFPDCNIKLH